MTPVQVPLNTQANVDLQTLNTLSVPARAEYFISARSVDEIRSALAWAASSNLPVTILGGGSNVVLSEKISGLVLQPQVLGVQLDRQSNLVTAGAGENWHSLVAWCVDNKLYGLENLALIPGLLGGAPIQNIGAYGVELKDVFYSLTAIEKTSGELKTFTRDECEFAYRDSIFKRRCKNQYVIVAVSLRFSRDTNVNIDYPELKKYFSERGVSSPTPEQVFGAVVEIRQAKLPDPVRLPNAGSFFKNPVIALEQYSVIKKRYPEIVAYSHSATEMKLAAAWLIDSLGWKGRERHGVVMHKNQALVLTNPNKVAAAEILKLAVEIQADVLNKFGVELEVEPQVV